MREITASITQRGQVTIPAEVRKVLGVKPREKVTFRIEADEVRLVPATFTIETAYGSVAPLEKPEDFDEITRSVKQERARRTVRKMRRR